MPTALSLDSFIQVATSPTPVDLDMLLIYKHNYMQRQLLYRGGEIVYKIFLLQWIPMNSVQKYYHSYFL